MEPSNAPLAEFQPNQATLAPPRTAIETSISVAVKAQVEAAVQARYLLAMNRPRDMDMVRQRLLKECDRPAFAEIARYSKPQGSGKIEGPSVRFVESALRCFGNVMPEEQVIYDDASCRIVRVTITDLESNLTYQADVIVTKEIERSSARGRDVISTRQNSNGGTTYTVVPTDDELLTRQNALISKMRRNVGLRLIPRDLVDEAMDRVVAVQKNKDKKDPEAARNIIFDQFGKLGITALEIKEYLGHEVGWEDMATLRAIGQGIVSRETTWRELVAEKKAADAAEEPDTSLIDKLKAKAAKGKPPEPEPPAIDTLPYEAMLQEATTPQQLEAALLKINEVLPVRAPGRAALDKLYYRRCEEMKAKP